MWTWEPGIFADHRQYDLERLDLCERQPSDDGQIVALSNDTQGWQFKTTPDTGKRTFGIAVSGVGPRGIRSVIARPYWR